MMRTTPARGAADDAGFSLVELLVAMLITGMVLSMIGTFYVNVARSTASARATRDAMGQTSLAVAAVRNAVTMASDNAVAASSSASSTTPAVNAGTATSLTVTSYSNTVASAVAPSLVTFALDASGYLTESRQAGVLAATGYWAFTGATTSRRVAGPFITGAGTPFFSYVDASGAVITPGSSGLVAADLSKVAFVRVTAKVANTTISGGADPVVLTTSIGLTNVLRDVDPSVSLPPLTGGR